jgi:surface protein
MKKINIIKVLLILAVTMFNQAWSLEKTIYGDEKNIEKIVKSEIKRLGKSANLNHIDVSRLTNLNAGYSVFGDTGFKGDISKWDVSNVIHMEQMFKWSKFKGDISDWDISSLKHRYQMFGEKPRHRKEHQPKFKD